MGDIMKISYTFRVLSGVRFKKLSKVLLVTTGALFSPTFLFQKQNILGIAHAVSMEVVK